MFIEITRLALGILIALFHRPIADFIIGQERALVIMFRQRGVPLPAVPTTETVRNVYFGLGIGLAIFEILRIWILLHPMSALSALLIR